MNYTHKAIIILNMFYSRHNREDADICHWSYRIGIRLGKMLVQEWDCVKVLMDTDFIHITQGGTK